MENIYINRNAICPKNLRWQLFESARSMVGLSIRPMTLRKMKSRLETATSFSSCDVWFTYARLPPRAETLTRWRSISTQCRNEINDGITKRKKTTENNMRKEKWKFWMDLQLMSFWSGINISIIKTDANL